MLVMDEIFRVLGPGGIAVMDVVRQTRFSKKVLLEMFHTFVEMQTATYVFHQLQNVTQKYLDEFGSMEKIPLHEIELYKLANDLILAESVIESTLCYNPPFPPLTSLS